MSSLRNVVHRRTHKERSQPEERSKWGLLEKHKDYSLRAKDYNEKRAKLKILRQKAAERNADEFHFSMMSHRTTDGGKRAKKSEFAGMSHATSQLLKTQDAGYLRTMIQSTRHARQRLAEEIALQRAQLEGGSESGAMTAVARTEKPARKHLVFVDDRAEQKAYRGSRSRPGKRRQAEGEIDEDEDMEDDATTVEARKLSKESRGVEGVDPEADEQRRKTIASQERKLEALRLREEALVEAENALELQRAKMSNSVGGVTKAGLKFRIKERKK